MADAYTGVRLAMTAQAARVLAAAKMLDVQFGRRVLNYLPQNAHALDQRLPDAGIARVLVKQNAAELNAPPLLTRDVIHLHHIAFADRVLPGTIFKDCVIRIEHRKHLEKYLDQPKM